MRYTSVQDLSVPISCLAFGTWGLGGRTPGLTSYGSVNDADSIKALESAIDLGITLFDTSNVYGAGHSESILGQVTKGARDKVLIATKVGWPAFDAPSDFTPDGMERSLVQSLKRLNTECVDILQLHNPPENWLDTSPHILDSLLEFKNKGLTRLIGVSVQSPKEITKLIEMSDIRFIQLNFNLLDIRAAQHKALETMAASDRYVFARTPLCFGYLTDVVLSDSSFREGDHRRAWPAKQRQLWADGAEKMRTLAKENGISSLTEMALRFCISFNGIASTITGMLTQDEVQKNVKAITRGPLDDDIVRGAMDLHEQHTFFATSRETSDEHRSTLARN